MNVVSEARQKSPPSELGAVKVYFNHVIALLDGQGTQKKKTIAVLSRAISLIIMASAAP